MVLQKVKNTKAEYPLTLLPSVCMFAVETVQTVTFSLSSQLFRDCFQDLRAVCVSIHRAETLLVPSHHGGGGVSRLGVGSVAAVCLLILLPRAGTRSIFFLANWHGWLAVMGFKTSLLLPKIRHPHVNCTVPQRVSDFTILPPKLHHKPDFYCYSLGRIHANLIGALPNCCAYSLCFKLDPAHTINLVRGFFFFF